ncbi:MAG: hypothetical protein ABFD20_08595 [Anaerolineales bacterium]
MKRSIVCLVAIGILTSFLLVGCAGPSGEAGPADEGSAQTALTSTPKPTAVSAGASQEAASEPTAQPAPTNTPKPASPTASTAGEEASESSAHADNLLTSLEAADLAYAQAREWRADAVLWSLQPVLGTLDPDWAKNDLASQWEVIFANQSDDKCFMVDIVDGQVESAREETYEVRTIDVPASAPVKRPGVSLQEAAQAAIAAGMPANPPELVVFYTIEDYTPEWNGRPTWQFDFPTADGPYCYAVDGLTGELLAILDQYGNDVRSTGGQVREQKPSGDARDTIGEFFSLLDEGEAEQAMDLMCSSAVANEQTRSMWLAAFEGLDSIAVDKIEEHMKDAWSDTMEYYQCALEVRLKPDAQPGLWEDGKITRYIGVQAENGVWKIREISMNP